MPSPPEDPWLWGSTPVPQNRGAIQLQVAKFNPAGSSGEQFLLLPNVRCVSVRRAIGIDPGHATFRYVFPFANQQAPQTLEQAVSTSFTGTLVINPDDQIVVKAVRPDGTTQFLFHGRALAFGGRLAAKVELATVQAVGIAKDLWSTPIDGAYLRDGGNVNGGADLQTDIPAQFNPKGQPNATDTPAWATGTPPGGAEGDYRYPTFLDPTIVRSPDIRKPWTLATAARYLIYRHVAAQTALTIPTGDSLDALLQAQVPKAGANFDPADATTFDLKPIVVTDRPITGRDWPTALNELLKDRGFGMSFDLGTGEDGTSPETTLRIFRIQLGAVKHLYLQARGAWFDATATNVGELEIERDCTEVVNRWRVVGRLNRYEAGVVLAPLFPMAAADGASLGAIAKFSRSDPNFADNDDAYRLFGFDETGEGHYANGSNTALTAISKLDAIFGGPTDNVPAYTNRRRPPIGDLFALDSNGKARRYQLAVSVDYAGAYPAVWDGTATWQVVQGGYALLKDRLGVRLTVDNPNGLKVGRSTAPDAPYPEGVCKVVESLCGGNTANKPVFFRLVAVLEGDQALAGTAEPLGGSPIARTITRLVDARDRLAVETIAPSSPYFDADNSNAAGVEVTRDDTDAATAEAVAARASSEAGILQGPVTIPHFTLFYGIGDRIDVINGRGIPLRTDNGSTGTAPIYPVIVGVEHHLEPHQKTVLTLSDQDGHRHRLEAKIRRGR